MPQSRPQLRLAEPPLGKVLVADAELLPRLDAVRATLRGAAAS